MHKIQTVKLVCPSAKNELRKATSKIVGIVSSWNKRSPRNSWVREVTTGMREKGINNIELVAREEWRRKVIL